MLGAGVAVAVLAGVSISRANDARDAASAANASAQSAITAAKTADTDAKAVSAAANAAQATANLGSCAINNLGADAFVSGPLVRVASPYVPLGTNTCPPNPSGV